MADMQQLQQIYSSYQVEIDKVYQKAPLLAGLWGMGADPRNDPCNAAFYENVERWVQAFSAENPGEETVLEAVKWILEAANLNQGAHTYWYYYVAQNHVMPLISLLTPADCRQLSQWYDKTYPKRERLPNHDKLYKLMCKRGKER